MTLNFLRKLLPAATLLLALACSPAFADSPNPPCQPPLMAKLSSPRSTWDSFMALTDRYMELLRGRGYTRQNYDELRALEAQLYTCFDLTGVPPSLCDSSAIETAICIREIVARFPPLPPDCFPDLKEAIAQIRDGHSAEWRYRDMPIEISRIDNGVYSDNYQFSLRTINQARQTFELLRGMPYVDKSVEGFWDTYSLTPGPMIPIEWIKALPSFALIEIDDQDIWQWALLILSYPFLFLVIYLADKLALALVSRFPEKLRHLRWLFVPLTAMAAFLAQANFMDVEVFITGNELWCVKLIAEAVSLIAALMIVIITGNLLADLTMSSKHFQRSGMNAHLVRFSIHIASIGLAIAILIQGLHMMGIALSTLLAGAGITGLAIALAAQETLRNLIGSVMLLLDKSFKVGQVIKVRGYEGAVEEMGLRSSKIRMSSGHLVSIPNEDLARSDIENIDERLSIHREEKLVLQEESSLKRLNQAIDILNDILAVKPGDPESQRLNGCINHPGEEPRVYFEKFGKDSLSIVFHYWFRPADNWKFMEHSQRVNKEIIRRLNEAGFKPALE